MAVAKVQKVNIIAHQSYRKQILEFLYDQGFMEIIPYAGDSQKNNTFSQADKADIEYELAKVKYALDFLYPYYHDSRSPIEKFTQGKPQVSITEVEKLKRNFDYIKAAETAENLGQRLNTLKSLINKFDDEEKILTPWRNLILNTHLDAETNSTKILLGCLEKKLYDDFYSKIVNKFINLEINKVNEDKALVYLSLIYIKEYEKDLSKFLSSEGFKQAELPLLDITPGEYIEKIRRERRDINKEVIQIENRARQLAGQNFYNLRILFDFLNWSLAQVQVQDDFSFTKKTFSVFGWVKKGELLRMEKGLKNITKTVTTVYLKTEDNEVPPVAMENTGFLKPFEFVTNIYGFPKYREIDPTPFLAGFFIVFFGLCLTDAGYGLALTVSTFLALKYLKVSGGFKKLLQVLFYGGIITFIAGVLTGGWFGIVLEELPTGLSWLAKPLIAVRLIDPVKNPLIMLVISLILGYVHLLYGNAINLWWQIKHGEVKSGLIESGVWMYFLLAIGFFIITSQNIAAGSFTGVALYIVYSAVALVILTQGKSKNFIMKILEGLSSLYFGVTGYISDILSYSRLLALGLATGIIGMVINIIGAMLNDMIPYVGWLLMILVLIGGHIFNMIISLVGAFIHSGRLQYVEFFKTFFEGGGREFAPFMRESKYINLIKK